MKKVITIVVILILIALGGWYLLYSQPGVEEDIDDSPEAEENIEEEEAEVEENIDDSPEAEENIEEEEAAEDNPYTEAESIDPIDERNVAIHEDLSPVLEEVFDQETKLIDSGDTTALTYVVSREMTSDDVTQIKDLLAETGYETERTETKDGFYDLDVSITDEALEERYNGEFNGNPYIQVWTNQRGEENAQMVIVKVL